MVKPRQHLLPPPHREIKPHQVALPPDGMGGINVASSFEFVSLSLSSLSSFFLSSFFRLPHLVCLPPRSTLIQWVNIYVLSSKIFLWLLGILSSILIFCCFNVIVVLLSGASVEYKCVHTNIDEGDREQIKVESVLLSQSIGSLGKFR